MQDTKARRHYRVAKKEIYEDPMEGVYVTKEEQKRFGFFMICLVALSFISMLPIALKKH